MEILVNSRKHVAWKLLNRDLNLYAVKVGKAYQDCKMMDMARGFYDYVENVIFLLILEFNSFF